MSSIGGNLPSYTVRHNPSPGVKPDAAKTGGSGGAQGGKVNEATQTPAPTIGEQIASADDFTAMAAQMRRRSTTEKTTRATEPYERILEDGSQEKIDSLQLVRQTPGISKETFLSLSRALFPDDSDFVLVLRELIKRRKAGSTELDFLDELLEEVWEKTNKKHCQAGINVGLKSRIFSKKMKVSAKALRDTYRDFLTSDIDERELYEQWIELYGAEHRAMVADYIETSLLHDIGTHDPSCSQAEFGDLLHQFVLIKKLEASDADFLNVFLRGAVKMVLLEKEILRCWCDCLCRPLKIKKEIDKQQLKNLANELHMPAPQLQQKLLQAIGKMDETLFFDPEVKQILIDALLGLPFPEQSQRCGDIEITKRA